MTIGNSEMKNFCLPWLATFFKEKHLLKRSQIATPNLKKVQINMVYVPFLSILSLFMGRIFDTSSRI